MQAKLTPVFRQIGQAYLAGHDLIILQGGQGSSKTWSALQFFDLIAKHSPERFIFTICTKRSIITIDRGILHMCKKPPIWWVEKIIQFGSKINDTTFKKGKLFICGEWTI